MIGDSEIISTLMERVTWLESRDVALRALLHDWQEFATTIKPRYSGGDSELYSLKARTQEVLRP